MCERFWEDDQHKKCVDHMIARLVKYVNKFGYELNIFQVKGVISYLYK